MSEESNERLSDVEIAEKEKCCVCKKWEPDKLKDLCSLLL